MNIKKFAAIFGLTLLLGGMLPGGVYARWSPDANQRKAERKYLRTGKINEGFQSNGKGGIMPAGYELDANGSAYYPGKDAYDAGIAQYYRDHPEYNKIVIDGVITSRGGLTLGDITRLYGNWIPETTVFVNGQQITTAGHWELPSTGIGSPVDGSFAGFYRIGLENRFYPIGYSSRGGDGDGGGGGGGDYPYPTYPPLPTWTPTPTPTPTTAPLPWSKIKDSSYMGESIVSRIPASPIAYDEEDTAQPYLIIGQGGPVMAPYIGITGLNASARPNASNWQSVYEPRGFYNDTMGFENFASYIKARKTYTSISSLSEINGDGIYMWEGVEAFEITEVPSAFNQYNVVLVSTAPITINLTGSFSPAKSVAILSSSISFAPTVTEARGIFIGSQVATGETTDQGLKIIGNLIAKDNMVDGRRWSTLSRPSLFIVFKPEMYTDLLPYLSVANYEWEQTQ
ncbi:MAG: hypothetical protein ACOYYU_17605 [Chloroflexota bacterium]